MWPKGHGQWVGGLVRLERLLALQRWSFPLTAGRVVCKCQIETRTRAAIGRANGYGSVDGERAQRWARTTPPSGWTGWLDATAAGRPFLRPVTLATSVIRRHAL